MELDSKTKLIDAAIVLFANDGFDKVSIRKIAETANVNSALISYYFQGKRGLYLAAIDKQSDDLLTFIESAKNSKLTPPEILTLYAKTMLHLHLKNPYLIKIIYREFLGPPIFLDLFLKNKIHDLFIILCTSIKNGIDKQYFRQDLQVEQTVVLLIGMINFYFIGQPIRDKVLKQTDYTADCYMEQAIKIFLAGIKRRD